MQNKMQNKMKKLLHWVNGIKLRYKLLFAGDAFVFAELSADAKYY